MEDNKIHRVDGKIVPGPGGINCPCCVKCGRTHAKRLINRRARRKNRQVTKKDL